MSTLRKPKKIYTHGNITWSDGKKYVGELKNGKMHGNGVLTLPNKTKYIGEFKNGKKHGRGLVVRNNGVRYNGRWKDGKLHKSEGCYHESSSPGSEYAYDSF